MERYDHSTRARAREHSGGEALASRIQTGCVYDAQPSGAFGLLVTRADPRSWRRRPAGLAHIHAHWPRFAPSMRLLTGHDMACPARRCHGSGRLAGHAAIHLGWPTFAAAHRAELEAWPLLTRLAVALQIVGWLRAFDTVTVLSFERRRPEDSTPECWAQRHVFCDWVCGLLPLARPLGASSSCAINEGWGGGGGQGLRV
jgi:hypothetical protein